MPNPTKPDTETTRYCVACKYCDQSAKDAEYYTCGAPENFAVSHINGKQRPIATHCQTARMFDHLCGKTGQWFSPAEIAEKVAAE